MKQKVTILLAMLLLLTLGTLSAFGETFSDAKGEHLIDGAGLLSVDEFDQLEDQIETISHTHGVDVIILTMDSLDGYDAQDRADQGILDFYDVPYGEGDDAGDAILLLLSMEYRDYAVSTHGKAMSIFTDAGQEYIDDQFLGYLSDGDYFKGFTVFAEQTDKFMTQAEKGDPYDQGHLPKVISGKKILISLGIGLVVAIFSVLGMRGQLKSVRFAAAASNYVVAGSENITVARDQFLYSTVSKTRRAKEKNDGGGSSSHSYGGGSFGGHSGKF